MNDGVVIADGYRYVTIFRGQRVSAADPDVPAWMAEIAASMNAIAVPAE